MERKNKIIKTLLHLIFLCIPTVVAIAFALKGMTEYYAMIANDWFLQTCFFFAGISIACVLFASRLRFLPISAILFIILLILRYLIANAELPEFNTFLYLMWFRIYSALFVLGWICGWGFVRLKNFGFVVASIIVLFAIIFTISNSVFSFKGILKMFLPAVLFAFYIIYMSLAIRNIVNISAGRFMNLLRNLFGILILFLLLMIGIASLMKPVFSQIEKDWDKKSEKNEFDGLLERNSQDSTYKVKEKMRPNPTFGRNSENPQPMFAAYIDNFLDDEQEIPNPLYFVSHYLTNFDSFTETFERDTIIPYNDLFDPRLSEIDLYFSKTDTSIMNIALRDTLKKIVDVDVYNINLSVNEFIAPLTAHFCRPVAVEDNYKSIFKSAYHTKSVVSELNSAYFVYPSRDPMLLFYQQQRYDVLSAVENFDELPEIFYNYYTSLPNNDFIDSVKNLTKQITAKCETPAEKMLAIRDYFFAVNEFGEPDFKYSENPGIPGIPSASKLAYFLFESHKGYCAHFAGVTLFMLRACGIPARLTVGFATIDRSDKNKGWYWFYEDQAHAWVQVYFPKFGWLDFDTTIGNDDMEEAPQPDGTPPIQLNKANFAGSGKITSIDTIAKMIDFVLDKMILNDKEYKFDEPQKILLDMSAAKILRDTDAVKLSELANDISGLSLSFDEDLKTLATPANASTDDVLELLPQPVKIDEFRIDNKKQDKTDDKKPNDDKNLNSNKINKTTTLLLCVIIAGSLLILLFAMPYIIFKYYKFRAKTKSKNVDVFYVYKTSMFLLNQLGHSRKNLTPLQFAASIIDKEYETQLEKFMTAYLQLKYANVDITCAEKEFLNNFYADFEKTVTKKYKITKRIAKFLNIKQTLKFYTNNYGTTRYNN